MIGSMEENAKEPNKVACRYCKESINSDAKVCHYCDRDQRKWLNRIRDFSGPTAFAMVLIAAVQVFVSFEQVSETRKGRVEAEDVLYEANDVLKKTEKLRVNARSILTMTKENSEEAIKKSDLVLKEAAEKAKEAVEFARVAENKADKSNKKIISNEKKYSESFERVQGSFHDLKRQLTEELMILQDRNELTRLADAAIATCSRESFEKITNIIYKSKNEDEVMAALSENFRVKAHYVSISRIKNNPLYYNGKLDVDMSTEELLKLLAFSEEWKGRARAAQILGKRKEKNVAEALMSAVRTDKCLDVVNEAKKSFGLLTKFKQKDIFQFEEVDDWWNINKDEYLKDLK